MSVMRARGGGLRRGKGGQGGSMWDGGEGCRRRAGKEE